MSNVIFPELKIYKESKAMWIGKGNSWGQTVEIPTSKLRQNGESLMEFEQGSVKINLIAGNWIGDGTNYR